ncbi:hypothetical protein [Streptomyces xanthochromogenes]
MNLRALIDALMRGILTGAILTPPASALDWAVFGTPYDLLRLLLTIWDLYVFLVWPGIQIRTRREIRRLETAFHQPAYGDQ